jgi:hypothetical protein
MMTPNRRLRRILRPVAAVALALAGLDLDAGSASAGGLCKKYVLLMAQEDPAPQRVVVRRTVRTVQPADDTADRAATTPTKAAPSPQAPSKDVEAPRTTTRKVTRTVTTYEEEVPVQETRAVTPADEAVRTVRVVRAVPVTTQRVLVVRDATPATAVLFKKHCGW